MWRLEDLIYDLSLSIPLFLIVVLAVVFTKKLKNKWRNRKYIHFSSIPAVLAYIYLFKEPFVFSIFSFSLTVFLFYNHKKKRLLNWFQIDKNLGEVWFSLSFFIISLVFWYINKIAGGLIMLFMSLGDGITGIVRSFFVKTRRKHISGSLAMLLVSLSIGYLFLGKIGIIMGLVATFSESFSEIDDNISVPLFTSLTYALLLLVSRFL